MKVKALPRLHFEHTFQDGRVMTITVERSKNRLPEMICKPQFCGAEDEATLYEYAIWRNTIFDTLLSILTDDEILRVAKSGMNK